MICHKITTEEANKYHIFIGSDETIRIICLTPRYKEACSTNNIHSLQSESWTAVHAVLFSPQNYLIATQFWQHTGEGISSRHAEHCLSIFESYTEACSEPRSRVNSQAGSTGTKPPQYDDDIPKFKIRERIAACISTDTDLVLLDDVFLYPSGMNAIADLYRSLPLAFDDPEHKQKVITYGFVYVDTFKVLSKFGQKNAVLLGHGSTDELDALEAQLVAGEKIMALFCEMPGNPLLIAPDIARIKALSDKYDFVVVCDDTVGTFVNIDLLPFVDVVATSLTKLFSGGCNVMGGR